MGAGVTLLSAALGIVFGAAAAAFVFALTAHARRAAEDEDATYFSPVGKELERVDDDR